MQESVSELLAEVATLAFDLLVTIVLTVAGIRAELHSMHLFQTDMTMALWFGYMGAVALYGGLVVFGADRIRARLQTRLASEA